jgi:hypothetical protein
MFNSSPVFLCLCASVLNGRILRTLLPPCPYLCVLCGLCGLCG